MGCVAEGKVVKDGYVELIKPIIPGDRWAVALWPYNPDDMPPEGDQDCVCTDQYDDCSEKAARFIYESWL